MKIVKQISTGKILYKSSPEFETGKGIINARILYPDILGADMEETNLTASDIISELKLNKKIQTKAAARKKIIAIANEDKQRNYTARFSELLEKRVKGITLTQVEIDEMNFLRGIWDRVRALRASSDTIEAEIDALATAAEVNAYVIEPNALWERGRRIYQEAGIEA